jgi:ketosteroid isomerase-like protein
MMAQADVERTHRVFDAFARRDLDAYLALVDPDIEFTPYEVAVQGGSPYRGKDGVRRWWEESLSVLNIQPEVDEVRDLQDSKVLIRGTLRGEGVGSGASFARSFYLVAQWRDGKVIWWHNHESETEALAAAGITE